MKIFMSVDIEGINGICSWDETEHDSPRYAEFQKELQKEVNAACRGALKAGATEIVIKDAHDSARNLNCLDLPKEARLLRGWVGSPCSMMAGLDETYDAVMFVGYHSPSRSNQNSLSHTMNTTRVFEVKINGIQTSEFYINSLFASYLNVPVAFLSGDKHLTEIVKEQNENIETVVSKEGVHGGVISPHPEITWGEIEEGAYKALKKDLSQNLVPLPKKFKIEIQYKKHNDAYNASFFPGCKLVDTDKILFETNDYYKALVMFKFCL